jgi:hypothetical protein
MQYVVPDYSEQGAQAFRVFVHNQEALDSLACPGAYSDNVIVGVFATRNNGHHIVPSFVDGRYYGQGIGRKRFETVLPKKRTGEKSK